MRPVTHSEEFPVVKTPENLTFSDSDKDHRQQGGEQFYCNLIFEANCSPSEPHLLTQNLLVMKTLILIKITNSKWGNNFIAI
jgi:hypothetical protein